MFSGKSRSEERAKGGGWETRYRLSVALLLALWSGVVAAAAGWTWRAGRRSVLDNARIAARSAFEKDLIYRRWNSRNGGVYAPVTEETPPNPYLTNVPERDISTPSGRRLTLVNPAYMTRQVHELGVQAGSPPAHITSLNPIRPQNAPDPWEAQALARIEAQGPPPASGLVPAPEVSALQELDGRQYLRLMKPLYTEASCLRCHAAQGYREGDLRGGISVSVPMAPLWSVFRRQMVRVGAGFGTVWIIGLAGIISAVGTVRRRVGERLAATDALAREKARLQSLVRANPAGIGLTKNRVFLDASDQLCRMVGYSRKELIGSNTRMLYPDDEEYDRVLRRAVTQLEGGSQGVAVVEARWRHRDGRVLDVLLWASPVEGKDPSAGITIAAVDITERKRLETRMQQVRTLESLGILAGGIAHDFNNLLMVILGNAEMARDELPDGSEAREFLEELESAARRAAELSGQMLAYSGKGVFAAEILDLRALVEEARESLETSIPDRVQVTFRFPHSLSPILGDARQIRTVIRNLMLNSVEAIGEGNGEVIVSLDTRECDRECLAGTYLDDGLTPGAYVLLEVRDSGAGMTSEVRERVFDPFFSTRFAGRGLGMSVVLGIVRGHQGAISVESEPGRGTTVRVFFPAANERTDRTGGTNGNG